MNRLSTGARRSGRFVAAVLAVRMRDGCDCRNRPRQDQLGRQSPRSTQATTTITLAHWASSTVETELLRQVLAAFENKYPTINVNALGLDPYPDPDARAVRGEEAAGRVLRRLERVAGLDQAGRAPGAVAATVKQYNFRTKPFYPAAAPAPSSQGEDLRVPEGLVAARDADEHGDAPARRRAGTAETWAQLTTTAQRLGANAVPAASRSASAPTGPGRSRSSTRTAARS